MQSILKSLESPQAIRGLSVAQLEQLAQEVRDLIIQTVSDTGGHLAANLGVVELTIALLSVFDPPEDKLVWDTGHQTYAYKILTDRRDRFKTLRQEGGISGFPRRDESPYDAFGAGHAGTALSAALGFAAQRDIAGGHEDVVSIIGDAAMCNGISLEALNNVSSAARRLVVVLNDNEMSISGNVGALSRYLGKLLANPRYNRIKSTVEDIAEKLRMGVLRPGYHRVEEALKSFFVGNVFFEELGLRYVGPIDGHNIHALQDALTIAKDYDCPILLHVATQKGKGYAPAESEPEKWHGTSCFDVDTATSLSPKRPGYSEMFGHVLCEQAKKNDRICGITAAMCKGTGMRNFSSRFAQRFFDVGICEEHALVFAAGMAASGALPVVALYATFVQRAADCVMHDICLQDLPVILCLDRAGVVGDDGPTHHGIYDIAMLRPFPNVSIMQPRCQEELSQMFAAAVAYNGPVVIRYPRGTAVSDPSVNAEESIEWGKAEVVRSTTGSADALWLWALGDMLPHAVDAAERLSQSRFDVGVVNARFVKPLDVALLKQQVVAGCHRFVTIENGARSGGFGSAVLETLSEMTAETHLLRLGWPDAFVTHGRVDRLFEIHGLDATAVASNVESWCSGFKGGKKS